jgi:hypothetical protein
MPTPYKKWEAAYALWLQGMQNNEREIASTRARTLQFTNSVAVCPLVAFYQVRDVYNQFLLAHRGSALTIPDRVQLSINAYGGDVKFRYFSAYIDNLITKNTFGKVLDYLPAYLGDSEGMTSVTVTFRNFLKYVPLDTHDNNIKLYNLFARDSINNFMVDIKIKSIEDLFTYVINIGKKIDLSLAYQQAPKTLTDIINAQLKDIEKLVQDRITSLETEIKDFFNRYNWSILYNPKPYMDLCQIFLDNITTNVKSIFNFFIDDCKTNLNKDDWSFLYKPEPLIQKCKLYLSNISTNVNDFLGYQIIIINKMIELADSILTGRSGITVRILSDMVELIIVKIQNYYYDTYFTINPNIVVAINYWGQQLELYLRKIRAIILNLDRFNDVYDDELIYNAHLTQQDYLKAIANIIIQASPRIETQINLDDELIQTYWM